MNREHVLEIADAIEAHSDEYSQTSGCRCIGGFCLGAMRSKSASPVYYGSYLDGAETYLEIPREISLPLTTGHPIMDGSPLGCRPPTAAEAVATLRYLAQTGTVNWAEGIRQARAVQALKDQPQDRSLPIAYDDEEALEEEVA